MTKMERPWSCQRIVRACSPYALICFLFALKIYSESYRLGGVNVLANDNETAVNEIPSWKHQQEEDRKKYFVIHLGPPKTATTSLQMDLTNNTHDLSLDNYTYQGTYINEKGRTYNSKFFINLAGSECHMELYMAREVYNNSTIPKCWQTIETELASMAGQSVVLSSEPWSFVWRRFGSHPAPFDWVGLQDTLDRYNYTLMVTLTYRRLYELLPSWKQQQHRYKPAKKLLNRWPAHGGKQLEPLFPEVLRHPLVSSRNPNKPLEAPMVMSLEMLKAYNIINVRILNLYSDKYKSVKSNFLCNVLPTAYRSCQLSVEADQAGKKETRANPEQSLFYDALVTAAAEAGMINVTQHHRHNVVVAVQKHQELHLNQTALDLATKCPSTADLERLLQASLQREAAIMPDLHATQEQAHRDAFWKAVEKKKFCWIDTDATLNTDEWKGFFAQYV